KSQNKTKRK
ncbi:transposase, partial [Bacillus cereus]